MTNNQPNPLPSRRVPSVAVVLLRLVVGGVFVFSGFAKAIDPWGSYYKITEYVLALGWPGVAGLSLVAAVCIAAVECVLGVLLAVGAFRRSVPLLLLLLTLCLTPLTLWLAITRAVADCGCFGDALHLGNWATFGKNLLLLAGLCMLLWQGRHVRGWYGPAVQWIVGALTLAATLAVAWHGYFVQPLADFRPYPVGTRLATATADDADDYLFIYEKNGERQEFTLDSLPDEEAGWEYVDRRPASARRAAVVERSGHQLSLLDGGLDVTAEVLGDSSVLLILFPDLPRVSLAHAFVINQLVDHARAHHTSVAGVTAATEQQIEHWNDLSMAAYPMLEADDSDIKMLARGNPAVVYVSQGVVQWKRTLGSIDSHKLHAAELDPATLGDDMDARGTLRGILIPYAALMAALLFINRIHLLLRRVFRREAGAPRDADQPTPPAQPQDGQETTTAED
ncbi:MAG: DoxX family membrane protein [Muribaculaceae bacterium]|nr:DoxX family membrane protein [Muribaculaceae bacterium]